MASLKERLSAKLAELRKRRPVVDHVVRMQQHYGAVDGGQQAGAVTYFAFLSFFPIMALAFFVVGYVAKVYPEAQQDLVLAVDAVLPGLVGAGEGQVSVQTIEDAAGTVGLIGLVGLLYAGLGWMSALRNALGTVFEQPEEDEANFVMGKLRDMLSLLVLGGVLILSVAVAGLVTGFSDVVLGWFNLDSTLGWMVTLLGRVVGFGANVVLFYAFFRLPAHTHVPTRSKWSGALLGAIAFEGLKAFSFVLLGSTEGRPAFQAFGIALILVVWMNYFSRVVLYAASWAYTSVTARAIRDREALERARMEELTKVDLREAPVSAEVAIAQAGSGRAVDKKSAAVGGAATLALVALLRKRKKDTS